MFENEDVDDDYFTPMVKTSLASIFKEPVFVEKSQNETLKYTPPTPKPMPTSKPIQSQEEPQKSYENIFSCVFDAYLWLDNVYTHKGKLGCAVIKHNATEGSKSFNSIFLYDSKRTTVSSAIATTTLQVTVKGKDVVSYYDKYDKYWCLRGTEDDVKKIIDALRTCNVSINNLNEDDNSLPQQKQIGSDATTDVSKKIVESDTDSSINRKTKASILNRMANMGQSVLPPRVVSIEPSSDSDTNEDQVIAVRHKPVKNMAKKAVSEKSMIESHKTEVQKAVLPIARNTDSTYMSIENQLQSSFSTPIATTSGHNLNNFFTEQRISNSELRINMSRITDKVDNILDKVNNLEKDRNDGSAINTMIYQKLIQEYENKIKTYEEMLLKADKNKCYVNKDNILTEMKEKDELVNELSNKIIELDNCIKLKDDEISILNNEVKKLRETSTSNSQNSREIEDELRTKISEYEDIIKKNNEKLSNLTTGNDQIEHKIKSIMNTTFRAIDINFVSNETYSGEIIKNTIGTIIKKITIESLKQSN